jgi:S1-C subfamily serine protease
VNGFCNSNNVAKPIIQDVIRDGSYKTPVFGAVSFNRELASFIDGRINSGVYISKVNKNTPAEKAGLKARDIIISCNNCAINTMTDLDEVFYSTEAGKDIKLKVRGSDGTVRDVDLVSEP